jgi:hypothetical protein
VLLAHGADPLSKNNAEMTPLEYIQLVGVECAGLTRKLVEAGGNPSSSAGPVRSDPTCRDNTSHDFDTCLGWVPTLRDSVAHQRSVLSLRTNVACRGYAEVV